MFWERPWRLSGVNFVFLIIVATFIFGRQPDNGASADELTAFYVGDRSRILIATVLSGVNILNLMWFAAALRTTLVDAGRDGWGAAVITASALYGGLSFLILTLTSALRLHNRGQSVSRERLAWALAVVISFSRAMLVMLSAFGLWRAGLISKGLFAGDVAANAQPPGRHHLG